MNTHPNTGSTYGSVAEFAAEIGISRSSAYQGLRRGEIPHLRIGKRIIIPRAAIREWLLAAGTPGPQAEA